MPHHNHKVFPSLLSLSHSVWLFLCRTTFARAHQSIHPHRHVVSVGLSLSHSFSSHIIDWNVTLLLCKDTRRMSALEPRPQQMRESWSCVYVHLHSFFNLSLTHSTHSPQKELRYWYFVKAFDLSLLSIFFSFSSSLLTAFVKANSFWSFSSSPTKNILFFS